MLIQNNTYRVDAAVADQWYRWQLDHFIPGVMKTGFFSEYRCYELLEQEETDGKTFVIQFWAADKNQHDAYMEQYDRVFAEMARKKWGDQCIGFRTLLGAL